VRELVTPFPGESGAALASGEGGLRVHFEIALLDALAKVVRTPMSAFSLGDPRLLEAIAAHSEAVSGGRFDYARLLPVARRNSWIPEQKFRPHERFGAVNEYDVTFYDRFSTPALDSHFFERQALARGLNTERLTTVMFSAWIGRAPRRGSTGPLRHGPLTWPAS
jgi:hypothetical protein